MIIAANIVVGWYDANAIAVQSQSRDSIVIRCIVDIFILLKFKNNDYL